MLIYYPRSRGLKREKFSPSETKKPLLPKFVSFSLFAVLFEAAKAEFLPSGSRVRIRRREASALARAEAGICKGCNPLQTFSLVRFFVV